MVKYDQPGGREVADLSPKEPQTQSAPEGVRTTMTMMIMMMMRMMMMMTIITMKIFFVFFPPKDLIQSWHQGGPINYDDADDIDNSDNNDDDGDDDDGYGNLVLFYKKKNCRI